MTMVTTIFSRTPTRKLTRACATLAAVSVVTLLAACEKELILQGERFDARAPLDASLTVEGEAAPVDTSGVIENRAVPITLPAAQSVGDWTHRAGGTSHLQPHMSLRTTPARVWSVSIGSGNSRKYRITAAPIVAGGRVYAMDSLGRVSATSTAGKSLWSATLTPEGARGEVSGGGLAFGEGRVFASTGQAEVVALDPATGGIIWRQKISSSAAGAPTVDGGVVYVVGRDGTAWALKSSDGRVLWQFAGTPSVTGVIGGSAPATNANSVLFPFSTGELVSVLKDGGTPVWRAQVAGERRGRGYTSVTDVTGDPVIVGKTTFAGNQSGVTVALDTDTGQRLWTAKEASYGPVMPAGGSVFLISDEAKLVRLDASTGEVIWSVEMPLYTKTREKRRAAIFAHYGPVLAGGRLLVASGDGTLRFFNPTDGALSGTVDLPGGAAAAPAMAGGTLYVISGNGQLHAFR